VTEAGATVKGLTGLDVPALISNAMSKASTETPRRGGGSSGSGGSGGGGGNDRPTRRQPPAAPASGTPPTSTPPRSDAAPTIETQEQAEAALNRASQAINRAAGVAAELSTTMPPVPPLAAVRPIAEIDSETPVTEAAASLAASLRLVPGVENYLATPLSRLDRRGPSAMRAAWRLARGPLAAEYGDLTVGELMARFGGDSARQN
jgi:hypothetical protein